MMVRIALCQANLPVGDIDGNVDRIRTRIDQAREKGADRGGDRWAGCGGCRLRPKRRCVVMHIQQFGHNKKTPGGSIWK